MEISGGSLLKLHYKCNVAHNQLPLKLHFSITCQQVDSYGLCAVVHMMLHNSYMDIVKKESSDVDYVYLPRLPFKRYISCFIVVCNFYFCLAL